MASKKPLPQRPGKRPIFRPWITHPITGKRIYRKNGGMFIIWVDEPSANDGE